MRCCVLHQLHQKQPCQTAAESGLIEPSNHFITALCARMTKRHSHTLSLALGL